MDAAITGPRSAGETSKSPRLTSSIVTGETSFWSGAGNLVLRGLCVFDLRDPLYFIGQIGYYKQSERPVRKRSVDPISIRRSPTKKREAPGNPR